MAARFYHKAFWERGGDAGGASSATWDSRFGSKKNYGILPSKKEMSGAWDFINDPKDRAGSKQHQARWGFATEMAILDIECGNNNGV